MKKLLFAAAAFAVLVPALFTTAVFADSPGRLAEGSNLYQVRNVTKSEAYSLATSVTCDQTVKFSTEISNTQFSNISNVTVKATLDGTTKVSGVNSANETVTSDGKVTVTVEKGTLSYIAGSTQLLDINGKLIKGLPDTITTGGVNAGDLAGSTREFVQFQAKVSCPTTPNECKPGIPVGDARCTTTVTPPTTPPTTPPELPHTGAGESILGFLGLGAIVAGAAYFVASRRELNRK